MTPVEFAKQAGRCWKGYEPVPGKKPYSPDSCRPVGSKKKKETATGNTQVTDRQKVADHVLFAKQLGNWLRSPTVKTANVGRIVSRTLAPMVAKPSTARRLGTAALDWGVPGAVGIGTAATAYNNDMDFATSALLGGSAAAMASPRDYARAIRVGRANARATGTAPMSGIMGELKPQIQNKALLAGLSMVPTGAGLALSTAKDVRQSSGNINNATKAVADATGALNDVASQFKEQATSTAVDPDTKQPKGLFAKVDQISNRLTDFADSIPVVEDKESLTKMVESLSNIAQNASTYIKPAPTPVKGPDGKVIPAEEPSLGGALRNALTKDTLLDASSPYTWGLGAAAIGVPSVAYLVASLANRKRKRRAYSSS